MEIIPSSYAASSISNTGKWFVEFEVTEYKPPKGYDLFVNGHIIECPICDIRKHREPQEDFIKEQEMQL